MSFVTFCISVVSILLAGNLAQRNKEILFRIFTVIGMLSIVLTVIYMDIPGRLPELCNYIVKILVTGCVEYIYYDYVIYCYNDDEN